MEHLVDSNAQKETQQIAAMLIREGIPAMLLNDTAPGVFLESNGIYVVMKSDLLAMPVRIEMHAFVARRGAARDPESSRRRPGCARKPILYAFAKNRRTNREMTYPVTLPHGA
jgi:hypothetical protein